jgi:hypothetical protein
MPFVASVDGSFVAFRGPGGRANYPARSGSNTLGVAEGTNRSLVLNFDRPVVSALLHISDYEAPRGSHLDLVAYDAAGRELSRGRLDANGQSSGDGTIRRLSVSSRNISRVVVDFAHAVGYGINPLFDQTKVHKSGSTVPIKLQLIDAAGANRSSSAIVVHATGVYLISTGAGGTLDDAGNANPDFNFRYDSGGYIFNLKTTGYATGTYALAFTVGGDPVTHTVQFQVRQ